MSDCEEQCLARVLIIEDDDSISEVIVLALEMDGYHAITVASRNEALALISSENFEYIVMDLYMPGMGPFEFLEKVRMRKPAPKVILMTASDLVVAKAKSLGLQDWIGKPFELESLFKMLPRTRMADSAAGN